MVRIYVLLQNAYVHCLVPPVTCAPDVKTVTVWADARATRAAALHSARLLLPHLE